LQVGSDVATANTFYDLATPAMAWGCSHENIDSLATSGCHRLLEVAHLVVEKGPVEGVMGVWLTFGSDEFAKEVPAFDLFPGVAG